jgi:hypothetical protein
MRQFLGVLEKQASKYVGLCAWCAPGVPVYIEAYVTQLHPFHVARTRTAILQRFRDLNVAPDTIGKSMLCVEEIKSYTNRYFVAALRELSNDDCIEVLKDGSAFRLLQAGYDEAQKM